MPYTGMSYSPFSQIVFCQMMETIVSQCFPAWCPFAHNFLRNPWRIRGKIRVLNRSPTDGFFKFCRAVQQFFFFPCGVFFIRGGFKFVYFFPCVSRYKIFAQLITAVRWNKNVIMSAHLVDKRFWRFLKERADIFFSSVLHSLPKQ